MYFVAVAKPPLHKPPFACAGKVTTGNNGGKFLFEVEYEKASPDLHTKLFAKVPFPLSDKTKSDLGEGQMGSALIGPLQMLRGFDRWILRVPI